MSDNMQPADEILDDESLDAVDAEEFEEVEEFDPFEGMSDEELDALCDEDESLAGFGNVEPGFRSGFVALVGRPNAGKSTLLNACYGKKVAITSPVAQTTRRRMRAVVNRPGYQLVFVDTPKEKQRCYEHEGQQILPGNNLLHRHVTFFLSSV